MRAESVAARPAFYCGLAGATIAAGLVLRLVRMGLSFWAVKWGGSVLWAWMVYWLLAAMMPRAKALRLAGIAGAVAALVELSRLWHPAGMEAFRLTLAGKLLLGRVFSGWHFVVYWGAIALAAAMDQWALRRKAT